MKIASFNINGIKARLPALLDWLQERQPDVAVLQEIKSIDEAFPKEPIEELGYTVITHGQKSFNGVALLSKVPLDDVMMGLPGDDDDEQARYVEATVVGEKNALRLCGLYLPNGNPAPGPKYDYKLAWMHRLQTRAEELMASEEPFLITGDFNVIPQPEDCYDPKAWETDALFLPQTRQAFRKLCAIGLTDALRVRDAAPMTYTFWDYQAGAWNKNHGIRIDHVLLSPAAADMLTDCQIDRDCRDREKPSDHVPIWVDIDL
ncbi:MAG: exodeoxyribonuclease III [Pseudomonadota bacterium]